MTSSNMRNSGQLVPSPLRRKDFYEDSREERKALLNGRLVTMTFVGDYNPMVKVPFSGIPQALVEHYSNWAKEEFALPTWGSATYTFINAQDGITRTEPLLQVPAAFASVSGGDKLVRWLYDLTIKQKAYTLPKGDTFEQTARLYRLVAGMQIMEPVPVVLGQSLKEAITLGQWTVTAPAVLYGQGRSSAVGLQVGFAPADLDPILRGLPRNDPVRNVLMETIAFGDDSVFDVNMRSAWIAYWGQHPTLLHEMQAMVHRNW